MKTREFEELGVNVYKERTRASLRYRKVAISFAHTALFPMQEGL